MTDVPGNRCPFCGAPAPIIWVHGHGQCAFCGTNREPCCDGAPEDPLSAPLPTLITPRLILRPAAVSAEACPPGYGHWRISDANMPDGFVGEVSMMPRRGGSPEIELSFQIELVARGQGFAVEASRAVIDYAATRLGVTELVAFTHPDHRGLARVLRRLSFLAEGRRSVGEGRQVVVWRRRTQS
jgi:hypothetical protein